MVELRSRTITGFKIALGLLLAIALASCSTSADPTPKVTILGSITGDGAATIQEVFAPFTEATGIEVEYEGSDQFSSLMTIRLAAGNPPDLALFPQPGLMADLARRGQLVPLSEMLTQEQLQSAYADSWLQQASVDGEVYGLWARASLKSVVWYSPPAFEAAGYEVPQTWEELQTLSDRIVADGGVPWCIGMESGAATGWVGTDWVEELLLRQAGPEVYDQWVNHEIPFTDAAVQEAFEGFGAIALDSQKVLGGPLTVLSTPFGDSPVSLFSEEPGCYLHRQASFIATFFPQDIEPGVDVDVFQLPGIEPEFGNPLLVSGELFGVTSDRPEVQQLLSYFTTVEPHRIWTTAEGFVSPHQQVDLDLYESVTTRRQAEMLANTETIRFDASDLMPGPVGTGSFWTGVVDYVSGVDLDLVLQEIEESWPEEE